MPAELMPWVIGWGIAALVVIIAAGLLLWILIAARGIEREARRALAAASRLEVNTRPVWRLLEVRDALHDADERMKSAEERVQEATSESEGAPP